jgi:hypothetical protein
LLIAADRRDFTVPMGIEQCAAISLQLIPSRSNHGFASLVVDGAPGFYRIDLLTGRASLLGPLGDEVTDVALPLDQ